MKNGGSPAISAILEAGEAADRVESAAARFLETSDDLFAICGIDGRIRWVNPAHERVTGFSQDELVGQPYIDFIYGEDRERAMAESSRASAGQSTLGFEGRLRCKDGSHRWFLLTSTPSLEEELVFTVAKDVTDRRQLEHESIRFMDLSLDVLAIVDFDGYWRRVNRAFETTLGFRDEEIVNKPYLDFVHPDDRDALTREAQRLTLPRAETRDFRARFRTRDGSYRTLLWNATSSVDERQIYAVGRDESERERSEEAIREAEERFRGAFDQAPIGMALVSIESEGAGCFLRVNEALCEITGYSQQQLVGMGFHRIAHPDDYDPDIHYVPWMLVGEVAEYEVEKRILHAAGHHLWAQFSNSIVKDGNGRPLYLISQIQDITERKHAEQELMESRQRLQAIIDNTTSVVYVKDREGNFELVNRRFEQLHGIAKEEAIGKTAHDLFGEEQAEAMQADDHKVLHSGLSLELEETVEVGDGLRTYLTTKFPLLDPARAKPIPYAVCAISADITERKRAEEALRASEEHFRQIIRTAPDSFISIDEAGSVTAWNPQAESTLGWSEAEAIGQAFATRVLAGRNAETYHREVEQFLQTGRSTFFNRRFELQALHRDGHEFPVEMIITPVRVGATYVFNTFLHDITERRQAEEQIQRLASIVESSLDAVIGESLDGDITSWNRGAERMYGYRRDEVLGRPISIVLPEGREEEIPRVLERVRRGEEVSHYETERRRKDGTILSVSLSVSPVRDESGEITAASVVARDITERKQAEEALRATQEGFRSAFENAPIGVALESVEEDADGRLFQVNRSLCQITGYAASELTDLTLEQITHPDDLEAEHRLSDRMARGEISNYRLEKRYMRKDGLAVWVMHGASNVHDASGRLLYRLAQVEDITIRRHAQEELNRVHEELERRAAELERSNTDLQQFAYAASHDLSEPLRMVSSYVQLLSRRYSGKLDSDADEFIGYAVDGVARMQALIEGLLMYSRAGTSEYALAPVDCGEIVDVTLKMLKAAIDESEAEVNVGPLPTVEGDETQLAQLFQNLIANAIKFVAEGPPRIDVTAERDGVNWSFTVADNGIGIKPAHAERIFSVFQRLHAHGEYPGSGIGLAICKRIVERHGGRIWVEPSSEGGSSFHFTIPALLEATDNGRSAPGAT